jgi:hypothetical protein
VAGTEENCRIDIARRFIDAGLAPKKNPLAQRSIKENFAEADPLCALVCFSRGLNTQYSYVQHLDQGRTKEVCSDRVPSGFSTCIPVG